MPYPAATLALLKSRNKWYVYVTIPPELRASFGGKTQIRRSSGTADKKEAQRRLHEIAASIYAEFDNAKPNRKLDWARQVESFFHFLRGYEVDWQALATDGNSLDALTTTLRAQLEAAQTLPGDTKEAEVVDNLLDSLAALDEAKPNPNSLFRAVADEFLGQHKFSRQQLKKDAMRALSEFSEFTPDKSLSEIKPATLYAYADFLDKERGFANVTITGRIAKLQSVFNYAMRKGYIDINPAHNLRLAGYGKRRESYLPFTKEELHKIFSLKMNQRERLLFSILATTGMRLDEAALLKWDNIKEEDGVAYFDLTSEGYLVKNRGSARKIPIHPALQLPQRGTGRLFDYKTNADGKTTTASETANKLIRKVTKDRRKVCHSFRHTLKDLFRDAGVPKEVQDFITGHSSGDVAGKYGSGPSLKTRLEAITSVKHPWLEE